MHVGDEGTLAIACHHVAAEAVGLHCRQHLAGLRVDQQQAPGTFRRHQQAAVGEKGEAVWAAEAAKVDGRRHREPGKIDHCQRVAGLGIAIVGYHGDGRIRRHRHFVGARSGGKTGKLGAANRIANRQRAVEPIDHQQHVAGQYRGGKRQPSNHAHEPLP